jgi:serine/threonine protein kinase
VLKQKYLTGSGGSGAATKTKSNNGGGGLELHPVPSSSKARLVTEAHLLMQLKHPNVVKCFGTFWENGSQYIVLESCEGGDLRSLINKYVKILFPLSYRPRIIVATL